MKVKCVQDRQTILERKKTFENKIVHFHPNERLILRRGGGTKTERFERRVMRGQSHFFRGSQKFCFNVFLERSNSLYVLRKQMKPSKSGSF